ncbi:histidine phosphatase family protein [Heyndrickxia sporothermodurans]
MGNSKLTEKGIQNAVSLGKRLNQIELNAIYSNPSGRAHKTAELICGNRKVPILKLNGLKEINFCIWEGQIQTDIKKNYNKEFYAFWKTPHLFNPFKGGIQNENP